ncbi:hypothetical protein BGZ70_008735 [Mortierella alpina]|uniref:Glutathione peroxidase n=1 Tax=Mortierella alpina TaxID=64518 RepID=A0A9P6M0I6_MORAP|nr:hypothetical protein BGZ70_008735 [Mortierella alpina]
MKPQLGQSKLAILKHAPNAHRKRRPIDLRGRQSASSGTGLFGQSNSSDNSQLAALSGTSGGGVGGARRTTASGHPPSLLRRQTTRNKSFMDIDLPSMKMLRREPSIMELDPPQTLFNPTPNPSHFLPGPWAFFQAAGAQREQRQAQVEFLTRLQELRLRDEQQFVRVMAGFARDCPVQFSQLTGFMKQMEVEMATAGENSYFTQHQQQQQQQRQQQQQQRGNWNRTMAHREHKGTKSSLLELAQLFGNKVNHANSFHPQNQTQYHQQQQQQQQQQYGYQQGSLAGQGGQRSGDRRGSRGGRSRGGSSGMFGKASAMAGQQRQPPVPALRRGKTFQQQQQAMQQLTAYQRHLYQQVQQMHQQGQSPHGWQAPGHPNSLTSPVSTPMAHELMQYAAMAAVAERNGHHNSPVPSLLSGLSSPTSSQFSGPGSPLSPVGLGGLMGQQQQPHQGLAHDSTRQYSTTASTGSTQPTHFFDLKAKDKRLQEVSMADFENKVILVVNVASNCGFTPQYKELEQLYKDYKDQGLVVIGFPCNQFGGQEPGSEQEIESFCQVNFGVTFPLMAKIDVNGPQEDAVYTFLKSQKAGFLGLTRIKWNFEKFLIDRNGRVVQRYPSTTTPKAIAEDIKKLL